MLEGIIFGWKGTRLFNLDDLKGISKIRCSLTMSNVLFDCEKGYFKYYSSDLTKDRWLRVTDQEVLDFLNEDIKFNHSNAVKIIDIHGKVHRWDASIGLLLDAFDSISKGNVGTEITPELLVGVSEIELMYDGSCTTFKSRGEGKNFKISTRTPNGKIINSSMLEPFAVCFLLNKDIAEGFVDSLTFTDTVGNIFELV